MMSLSFLPNTRLLPNTKTILVFGDSLSDGFMLKRSEAYPALLAKKLRAAGLNFSVTNASASGGTTDGGLERLPPHLKHRIDILILELGINDVFRGLADRPNSKQSPTDHRQGESEKSKCARGDRRNATPRLYG